MPQKSGAAVRPAARPVTERFSAGQKKPPYLAGARAPRRLNLFHTGGKSPLIQAGDETVTRIPPSAPDLEGDRECVKAQTVLKTHETGERGEGFRKTPEALSFSIDSAFRVLLVPARRPIFSERRAGYTRTPRPRPGPAE